MQQLKLVNVLCQISILVLILEEQMHIAIVAAALLDVKTAQLAMFVCRACRDIT